MIALHARSRRWLPTRLKLELRLEIGDFVISLFLYVFDFE